LTDGSGTTVSFPKLKWVSDTYFSSDGFGGFSSSLNYPRYALQYLEYTLGGIFHCQWQLTLFLAAFSGSNPTWVMNVSSGDPIPSDWSSAAHSSSAGVPIVTLVPTVS
jgi:hypothetical protein